MKVFLSCCTILVMLFSLVFPVYAVEDPLSHTNNKIGIHILFPTEIETAAKLVNSAGGDWGYVVIPIQSGDKDLQKWQKFFDSAKKLHVIPIIRLATEGDYFNTKVWRKPTEADILDFANFLDSLSWPTKNRYIIVYNEVNRGDEWGGTPNPVEYATLLSYAVQVFKERSSDFFIISAGLDNAAATTATSINEYDFLAGMNIAVPGIFDDIDGIGSHSYPNPGFSQPPSVVSKESITSFTYERNFIEGHSGKQLPVFITETGWSQDAVGVDNAGKYLTTALQTVWNNNTIAVVAPFLLQAGPGPFAQFSLFSSTGAPNAVYNSLAAFPKLKGTPTVGSSSASVLAASTNNKNLPDKFFEEVRDSHFAQLFEVGFGKFFKLLLQVS